MYKKGISFILTVAFLLMLSSATFAGIQLNPVEAGDITLIEPQIGTEAQVFIKDSMAISIRTESDYPVNVSLYKVMPSAHDAYLDEACDSEMVIMADEVPFKVISGGSIVSRDALVNVEKDDLEDIAFFTDEIEDDVVDSDNIIDGSEALLKKDKLSSKDRQAVIKSFKKARNAFENKLEDLEDAFDEYIELFPDGHADEYSYNREELKIIKTYLIEVEEANTLCAEYVSAKEAYEAIFEIPLFGPEDLTDTGILPYYQKTVEKITPGLYKFVFSDKNSKEIIEVIEFEVVKKEELTEEDIKEAMPSTMGDLILPAKELIEEEIEVIEEIEEIEEVIEEIGETEEEVIEEIENDDLINTIEEEQQEEKPASDNSEK